MGFGSFTFQSGCDSTKESTDSALGSTNYSDNNDNTSDENYSLENSSSGKDSDGSGPAHQTPKRKRYWKKKSQNDKSNLIHPHETTLHVGSDSLEDVQYYTNESEDKYVYSRHFNKGEAFKDSDTLSRKIPSIRVETRQFVETVQSFILEGPHSSFSSDEEEMELINDDVIECSTFRLGSLNFPLASEICGSHSGTGVSKQSIMNTTYTVDGSDMKCNSVFNQPKFMQSKTSSYTGMECGSISKVSNQFPNVPQRPVNKSILSKPDFCHENKLKNMFPKPDFKLDVAFKNSEIVQKQQTKPFQYFGKHDSTKCGKSSINVSKPERLKDMPNSLLTPKSKIHLNLQLTAPATPGCTTEEIIQFMNSPLEVLMEQNNARAALEKSSRKHFSFSPEPATAESLDTESVDVETAFATLVSSIEDQEVGIKTPNRLPRNQCAKRSPRLLISPCNNLIVKSPRNCKRKIDNSKDFKATCKNMIERKFKDSDDRINSIVISDDDSSDAKAFSISAQKNTILTTHKPKHVHHQATQKIIVETKEHNDGSTSVKSNQLNNNSNEKDVWWVKKPSLPMEETRVIKTAARSTTSNNIKTEDIYANNTYSWFVNKHPDESSIDVSNVSMLSVIHKISPERCQSLSVDPVSYKNDVLQSPKSIRIPSRTSPRKQTPSNSTLKTSTLPSVRTSTPRKSKPKSFHIAKKIPNSKSNLNSITSISETSKEKKSSQGNSKSIKQGNSSNISSKNLSASFSCLGPGLCEKAFCFNCTFS
ncbi:uncharacterized protein [Antedon mediterranea]